MSSRILGALSTAIGLVVTLLVLPAPVDALATDPGDRPASTAATSPARVPAVSRRPGR